MMKERPDGTRFPDHEAEGAVLADFTDPSAKTGPGYEYQRTLGDLIVDALGCRDVLDGEPTGSHEDSESFEHAFLKRTALELRALNHALACSLTTDDHPADEFTLEQACELLRGLARRIDAGAELAQRLRTARWGHPSFGGGEAFLAEARAKFMASSPEQPESEADHG